MPNYKIKLTPLEYYFFGGEKHNEDLEANYFVESLNYPQQTTILGLLRYLILQENNLLNGKSISTANQIDAATLIGNESFSYGTKPDFKKIIKLSALYFTHLSKGDYHFAPLDVCFDLNDHFTLMHNGKSFFAKDHGQMIKQYLYSLNTGDLVDIEKIVETIVQVGNEKGDKGKSLEDAYYKQYLKKLNKEWSFCFDADIDVIFKQEEYLIPFGGEKFYFNVSIKKETPITPIFPLKYQRKVPAILCISDCFVRGDKIKDLEYGVTDFVSFRNFRSKISTNNHYSLPKNEDINMGLIRSSRYQLLKRGSVLYFTDIVTRDQFADEISKDDCTNIGFNTILNN